MMPTDPDHIGMYELLRLIEQANLLGASLSSGGLAVFADVSLETPKLSPPELGCIRVVSWLFVQYFEAGRIGVGFLDGKAAVYDHDSGVTLKRHRQTTQHLRTFFQHNLDSTKPHDRGIQDSCRAWFKEKCGTAVPAGDEHWAACLGGIINEAVNGLHVLVSTLRRIEADESCAQICDDWRLRVSRTLAPYQFDDLISIVAADMGRPEIDPAALRKRHHDQWVRHLGLLNEDADVRLEARKLVEHAILTAIPDILPITGRDLISEFQIAPGPLVGRLLEEARALCSQQRLSREDLLTKLRMQRGQEM
jgi:hypothetical protein